MKSLIQHKAKRFQNPVSLLWLGNLPGDRFTVPILGSGLGRRSNTIVLPDEACANWGKEFIEDRTRSLEQV